MENNVSAQIKKDQAPEAQKDWNWTRIALIAVVAIIVLALIVTLVFAILPPFAANRGVDS